MTDRIDPDHDPDRVGSSTICAEHCRIQINRLNGSRSINHFDWTGQVKEALRFLWQNERMPWSLKSVIIFNSAAVVRNAIYAPILAHSQHEEGKHIRISAP
jgi:hypothetical protein